MKKKRSIGRFVVIAVLCLIVAVLTIFSFRLPGSSQDNDFVGFARAVNLGIEYRGGTVQTYSAKLNTLTNNNLQDGISSNVSRIKSLLTDSSKMGYAEEDINVYQNGSNIVIELFDEYEPYGIEDVINEKSYFAIKNEQSDTAEAIVSAEDVASAYATTSNGQTILVIAFTQKGAENFQKVIDNTTGYFYIGSNSPFSLDVSKSNSAYIGITMTGRTLNQVKGYASEIVAAKYDMSFEKIDSATVVYTKADATKNIAVLLSLALGLLVVCFILLIAKYKYLGLVGSLTMLVGFLLQILILQAIPQTVFIMTSAAFFASILSMAIGALTLVIFYSNMHKEYKTGKILSASVKFGYGKTWAKAIDMFVVLLFPTILAYFFGAYLVKQFALALICGLAVYGVVTIVLTLFMTKWLTYIKFKNVSYGFKREANVNEFK